MKRLIVIFSLLLFAVGLQAQVMGTTKALNGGSLYVITPSTTVKTTAADSINGSDAASTTKYVTFDVNRPKLYYFTVQCQLDTTKLHHRVLANHVWVQVLGSMNNPTGNSGWTAIGNPVKFGASVDSTFVISDVSTGVLWRYLKVRFSGITAAKCSSLNTLILKVADK